ncbi:hypothetical protein [Streptomyces cucumeris]|uniref:hypothetical protein n=1 Tax=Streptomyces cucumeris TaxID=2962890 RepID=UPI0020C84397|nr:hypothetical protein [Streptomyces sp. NEAU-Y11]MCP9206716.1 hypothetical protein [Streptomyces sp. NEAU-Y11]
MNNTGTLAVHALPDGGAELQLVLHLSWDDVAALGREAGRLAAQLNRTVGLDEAASHRLSTRSTRVSPTDTSAAESRATSLAPPGPGMLQARSATDQSRHVLENTTGASATNHMAGGGGVHAAGPMPATTQGRGDASGGPRA